MDDTYKMILGPVAVALFLLLIAAWWRIRCLESDLRKKKKEIIDLKKSADDRVATAEKSQEEKVKAF